MTVSLSICHNYFLKTLIKITFFIATEIMHMHVVN